MARNLITPAKNISSTDAVFIIVGIVIGAGIFRAPSLVAANTGSDVTFFLAWVLGGLVSFIGALCYAELSTAFPNTGGDYHFIRRAFGNRPAFLFAWARMSVIQTGSIALLAYIFGDYLSELYRMGEHSSFIYAAAIIIILTAINIAGLRFGTGTQRLFTLSEVAGVLLVIVVGLLYQAQPAMSEPLQQPGGSGSSLGMAMVFVLLTFGGWNEAAYISAEIKSGSRGMVRALLISLLAITLLYVLINVAYIRVLGHHGLAGSSAAASGLMKIALGPSGGYIIGLLVAVSALTSANATIFTGARANYAMGKDFSAFSGLGKWNKRASGPVNAFLVQGGISLVLVTLGLFTRNGFETMIEYTAPVFWFFFFLTGVALFVLRKKEPDVHRPFRVPLYPFTPAIFCISSGCLLYSSLAYTGLGALVGVAVLITGMVVLMALPGYGNATRLEQQTEVRAPSG
ncbi:MAG: APC family permease [Daejeonella sp.]